MSYPRTGIIPAKAGIHLFSFQYNTSKAGKRNFGFLRADKLETMARPTERRRELGIRA
jgi:hypothetical protein